MYDFSGIQEQWSGGENSRSYHHPESVEGCICLHTKAFAILQTWVKELNTTVSTLKLENLCSSPNSYAKTQSPVK